MTFKSNAQTSSNDQANGQNDSWKAAGFLNFYMPGSDGKAAKLGAIPLKAGKGSDELIEWLGASADNAAKLLTAITVSYQSAAPANKSRFVLPA